MYLGDGNGKGLKRSKSPDKRKEYATSKKNEASKTKFKVAKMAHNLPFDKQEFQARTLSAFTDDEKSKNPPDIPAEYYHYMHWFGEDLQDQDDDYLDRTLLSPRQLITIQKQAITGRLR